ncbi:hypothetical protein FRB99_000213 [Tulasnella sp. 403]|nr:hypothetical protein FRB99_000213 [Tulasnella sp. 403]
MKQLYQMLHLLTTLTINLNNMCDSLDDQQAIKKEAGVTMLNSEVFYTIEDNQSCFKLAAIIALLKLFKRFLVCLAYTIYLTGGQPPHSIELMGMLMRNTPGHQQNLMVAHGQLINVDYFNKTTSTSGKDKLIPHRLPSKVSQMSVDYSCIVRPIKHLLSVSSGLFTAEQVQPILCKLFHIGLQKHDTGNLTQKLQFETQMYLKVTPGFGTADM